MRADDVAGNNCQGSKCVSMTWRAICARNYPDHLGDSGEGELVVGVDVVDGPRVDQPHRQPRLVVAAHVDIESKS